MTLQEAFGTLTPPTTIAPFPTESAAISQNEKICAYASGDVRRVYISAVGFSAGVVVPDLENLEVEEPIGYHPAVEVLRRARRVEEREFPVGGPFGA
jgi:hypothetical protein